jgi:hypothetical protein
MFKGVAKRSKSLAQLVSKDSADQGTMDATKATTGSAKQSKKQASSEDEDGEHRQHPQRLTFTEMLTMECDKDVRSSNIPHRVGQLPSFSQQGLSERNYESLPRDSGKHQRNESLHVTWTSEDIERLTKEIYEETIAPVHLSLLGYWIVERTQHYDIAKSYIRELSLDQVSQVLLHKLPG